MSRIILLLMTLKKIGKKIQKLSWLIGSYPIKEVHHDLFDEEPNETLRYYYFPREHWRSIRTNNPLERVMREIRRRTRAVGNFPDGRSALMLVAARLRHITATQWGMKRYLCMERLREHEKELLLVN